MSERTDEQNDDGLIKKPMKGSFERVGNRMAEEMSDKSPTEAVRDDDDMSRDSGDEQEG